MTDEKGLPNILIVDDEPGNIKILFELLQNEYNVQVATNGEKALRIALSDQKPDLILLDVMMPIMDGYELCQSLKSNEKTKKIPVIFITGKVSEEHEIKGFQVGGVDYITKPFSPVVVKSRVKTHILLKQMLEKQEKNLAEVKIEKHHYAHLLNALFPSMIVEELLESGKKISTKEYENVGILLIDIDYFEEYKKNNPASVIIENLQKYYQMCDQISSKHHVHKIKTEGESLLAVSGMMSKTGNSIFNCLSCAIDLIYNMEKLPMQWKLKIGIHMSILTGGIKEDSHQFLFDVWGDGFKTVRNIKNMMKPNHIFMTKEAWEQVKALSKTNSNGQLEIKGENEQENYLVEVSQEGFIINVDILTKEPK